MTTLAEMLDGRAPCPECGTVESLAKDHYGKPVCLACRRRAADGYDQYVTRLTSEDVEGWDE